jgi:hypothetical protein
MIRLGALVWLMLVVAAGFVTFKVKYAVQDIEDELNRVRKQTVAEQQEIRVLNAEWTYLNQPERLAELNRRFLQWGPIAAKQLQGKIDDIPFRPLPPPLPLPTPDILVAAAPAGGSAGSGERRLGAGFPRDRSGLGRRTARRIGSDQAGGDETGHPGAAGQGQRGASTALAR